jgi:hypothetical protein
MIMTTRCLGGLRLALLLAAIAALCGCATHTASAPPAAVSPMAEDAEPLPPGVTPLTVEQEETVGNGAE